MTKVLIVAGGTGGHIFPGLAVAAELSERGCAVEWIGTKLGLEATLVPQHHFKIHYINIYGFRGKNLLSKIKSGLSLGMAIIQAITLLIQLKPKLILGMGGFVAGPVGIAAWLLRKKLIIHEQNAVAGTSNRILGLFADQILTSFAHSFPSKDLYYKKIVLTGNPLRADFRLKHQDLIITQDDSFKILVLGGSRGSKFLNELIPTALAAVKGLTIVHQTGKEHLDLTIDLYQQHHATTGQYKVVTFIDNIVQAYLTADLIICRAGASTIFEIIATGSVSILIPLPWAIDDHQTHNAKDLKLRNAAIVIAQRDLTPVDLQAAVLELKNNPAKFRAMKQAIQNLAREYNLHDSTKLVTEHVLKYTN